ncbi:MAG: hypothetical protein GX974_04675 [Clostridiales bacterium]|nr:hypothetical protein [Clostridiales bacterium]
MNYTQNEKIMSITEKTLVVGVDIAKERGGVNMTMPIYWKNSLNDIESIVGSVAKGRANLLCHSAGGRDVYLVEYGKKNNINRMANYSSATGAKDPKRYADKSGENYVPTVLLVGAIHGGEMEGIVGILNLISLMETEVDLAGIPNHELLDATRDINLILIPCLNPDGRARVPFDSFVGKDLKTARHYFQGTWKDGSLCDWPDCKAIHPILGHVDFLGSYFNDDGINFMHDNFFAPMAKETRALFDVCDEWVPDITILLHGGSNTSPCLLQPRYVPVYMNNIVYDLSTNIKKAADKKGYIDMFRIIDVPTDRGEYPPVSFNLTSACSHVNGEVCITFESNQGLAEDNRHTPDEIYAAHMILFEETFSFVKNKRDPI